MRSRMIIALSFILTIGITSQAVAAQAAGTPKLRSMSRQVLEDKIRGGWAGQMIGVSFGAPTEFRSNGKINESEIKWAPDMVSNSIVQDDLYVEMTFAEVMDQVGLNATVEQYGDAFRDSQYELWHANAGARRALNQGIKAPWSGNPKYNFHADDIDFQIESDFIGLMTPGLPQAANKYADRVGHVMNYGDGVYGGMFFAGMYAAAFFESDPRKVVEAGLASIPAQSGYANVIRDVLDWSAKHPEDWKKTWQLIEDKWDRNDVCPDGALNNFNIDARLNGAYVALGLLYGKRDFATTLDISTRAGQDSDCNPSSAGGVLGVILGYNAIPEEWKSGIAKIADQKFDYTTYTFNTITESTIRRALKNIEMAGGKVTATEVFIPRQQPKPWKLEQWNPGIPYKLIGFDDAAWSWKGAWADEMTAQGHRPIGKMANGVGAEASLTFNGVAVVLVGPLSQEGGRADVYLDGKEAGQLDAFIVERTHDNVLWHIYGLKPGTHTVRIVLRNDADSRSKGNRVVVERAIAYR